MIFSFGFKSSVLLIFLFHGIIFTILLWIKGVRTENKSNIWLSLFTFLSTLYIAPFVLGYAGWYAQQPYRDFLFYFPFQQLFFIPPVLYFYIKSLLDKSFTFSRKDFLHFIPTVLYFLFSCIVVVTDKIVLEEYFFYQDQKDKDFSAWYQFSGFIFLVFYLIKSIRLYNQYKTTTYNTVSFADSLMFTWAKQFLFIFMVLVTIRFAFFIINPEWDEFGRKFWYYLSYSFLFYFISISGYSNNVISVTALHPIQPDANVHNQEANTVPIAKHNADKQPDIQDLAEWKIKIEKLIEENKLYQNPELVITDICEPLQTHAKKISQVINVGYEINFNDYINNFRVQALLQKLKNQEHTHKTLLALAFECGFNSKSTFNRAFKKHTALSPKEFIQKFHEK